MNDIELRWKSIVVEMPSNPGRFDRVKVLQYRKYYDANVYADGSNCGMLLRSMPRYKWSDWMDVPDA